MVRRKRKEFVSKTKHDRTLGSSGKMGMELKSSDSTQMSRQKDSCNCAKCSNANLLSGNPIATAEGKQHSDYVTPWVQFIYGFNSIMFDMYYCCVIIFLPGWLWLKA